MTKHLPEHVLDTADGDHFEITWGDPVLDGAVGLDLKDADGDQAVAILSPDDALALADALRKAVVGTTARAALKTRIPYAADPARSAR